MKETEQERLQSLSLLDLDPSSTFFQNQPERLIGKQLIYTVFLFAKVPGFEQDGIGYS